MPRPAHEQGALAIAVRAVREPLVTGRRWLPDTSELVGELADPGACFVTLERDGRLLGCIGSLAPHRPLGIDVAHNAAAAAFDDPRLPPVSWDDLIRLDVHISVLGPLEPLAVSDREQLAALLRPGTHGLLIDDGLHRATFLPSVWSQLPGAGSFLDALWRKAGLPPASWPDRLSVSRYEVSDLRGTATEYLPD